MYTLVNPSFSFHEKLPVSKVRYFGKFIIQLDGYFYVHVSSQWHIGLEKKSSSTRTSITSLTSLKFGQIRPRTAELAALERLEKSP